MCKLFISLFLFLEYRFLVESPTKVAIKTEFSKLFPIFFPVNNHIIIRCSQINADLRPPLWVVAVANWFYEGGSKKPPPTEVTTQHPYRKLLVNKA
mgnify:CR=1 FL=1